MRRQFLTVVGFKITIVRDVTPRSSAYSCQSFVGTLCLHLLDFFTTLKAFISYVILLYLEFQVSFRQISFFVQLFPLQTKNVETNEL